MGPYPRVQHLLCHGGLLRLQHLPHGCQRLRPRLVRPSLGGLLARRLLLRRLSHPGHPHHGCPLHLLRLHHLHLRHLGHPHHVGLGPPMGLSPPNPQAQHHLRQPGHNHLLPVQQAHLRHQLMGHPPQCRPPRPGDNPQQPLRPAPQVPIR